MKDTYSLDSSISCTDNERDKKFSNHNAFVFLVEKYDLWSSFVLLQDFVKIFSQQIVIFFPLNYFMGKLKCQ